MGCNASQEIEDSNAPSTPYRTTDEVVKKKGTLASSTKLDEYRKMMEELGAIDEEEAAKALESDDEFCDTREVRLCSFSDQNSSEHNHNETLLFEASAEASSSTPSTSVLVDSTLSTTLRRSRRAADSSFEDSLPGIVDEKQDSIKKICFSPDTPFVEGKPFPVSKRVKALQLLQQNLKPPAGRM